MEEAIHSEKSFYEFVVCDSNARIGLEEEAEQHWEIWIRTPEHSGNRLVELLSATRIFHESSELMTDGRKELCSGFLGRLNALEEDFQRDGRTCLWRSWTSRAIRGRMHDAPVGTGRNGSPSRSSRAD